MSELRVRDVTEADLLAVLAIRNRSFGPLGPGMEEWWNRIAAEVIPRRMLAVVDESDTVLGAGRARPYEQAWGGRHQPMGGVAGIYVEPSARGRGVASVLMRGLISRMGVLGDAVSCLYPTVPELYRGVGYEVGGVQPLRTYAAHDVRALRSLGGGLRPRAAGPDDAALVHDLLLEHAERHRLDGPVLPSLEVLRHQLGRDDAMHYVLDGIDGGGRGFVEYSLSEKGLTVEHIVGETPEAAAALWGVVGSGSSAAPTVRTYLDPRDPARLVIPSAPESEGSERTWMLRVIDLSKAVAVRGFSPHVTASAQVQVEDPDAPASSGHWAITVADGRGSAQKVSSRSDAATTRMGPRGLAALWCGWTMSRLRQAGLATAGTPDGDAALDAIFAGTPHMTEYF